ncbi:hypothetical protein HZA57_02630 [Candidatus Poribacteria bacterium]|nr:hypothetical protein [Candidatus Poribacteria bacterium]
MAAFRFGGPARPVVDRTAILYDHALGISGRSDAMANGVLAAELETYRRLHATLAGSEVRWVAIAGEELIGIFETYALALQAAYSARGLEPFLIKRIEAVDSMVLVTRMIAPCPS